MTAEQITSLLQYGVLGLVVVGFLSGLIHPKSRVDREVEISDKALESNEKAIAAIERLTAAVDAWRSAERRYEPRGVEGPR